MVRNRVLAVSASVQAVGAEPVELVVPVARAETACSTVSVARPGVPGWQPAHWWPGKLTRRTLDRKPHLVAIQHGSWSRSISVVLESGHSRCKRYRLVDRACCSQGSATVMAHR